jgi:tRNA threonylcarbamoyladenosine biosynthesis protein TsaE
VSTAPIVAHTHSPDETRELAMAVAGVLRPGDVLLLAGELGSGKTTFVQGLGWGLGVDEPVTSPTFTLVRAYPCGVDSAVAGGADGAVRTLLHADLYRLDRLREVIDLGIGELVEDAAVAVVEWGDVAASVLGHDAMAVHLVTGVADDERTVTFVLHGTWSARGPTLAPRLRHWTGDDARRRPTEV